MFFIFKKEKSFIQKYFLNRLEGSAGFTLIETMVAISILLMSVTSPIIIAKQGMVSARQARNSITAFYMAQDAIEYIRNVRDTNLLQYQANNWLDNLSNCISSFNGGKFCQVDTLAPTFASAFSVCTGDCDYIYKQVDESGNFQFYVYDYDSNDINTGFIRNVKILVEPTNFNDEVRVEVQILWGKNKEKSFFVSESLQKLVENN